jgi:hypothetical protein
MLATASIDCAPWVTPIFFNYDDSYRFVWESASDARHSRLIAENPSVALVVPDLLGKGGFSRAVYFEAKANEVSPERVPEALAWLLNGHHRKSDGMHRTARDYLGESSLRLYESLPSRVFGIEPVPVGGGRFVDQRFEIDLLGPSGKAHG